MNRTKTLLITLLALAALLVACSVQTEGNGKPQVVATTTILGDVVAQVAGEHFGVRVLLPTGGDPHSYQPTPQDLVAIEEAPLVFLNGFGLEESLETLIEDNIEKEKIIEVSEGIAPLYFDESEEEHEGHEEQEGHDHEGVDPHVWMNPQNVLVWVDNISTALTALAPEHQADFQANADAYIQELDDLHNWALEQFASVPGDNRLLVSDHETFNYLADAYDLEVVGALTGFSSLSETSAQELAALEDAISDLGVPAIFVSTTVPPGLAERVAGDTGVQVVRVYTGSLSDADGPASTYIEMMRNTISLITEALK